MDITGGYQAEEDTGVTAAIREADLWQDVLTPVFCGWLRVEIKTKRAELGWWRTVVKVDPWEDAVIAMFSVAVAGGDQVEDGRRGD